jgi:hypothetical protein
MQKNTLEQHGALKYSIMYKINKVLFSKCIICFIVFLLSVTLKSYSQSKDVKKIMKVIELEELYWTKGDIEAYVSLYAPLDSTRMILSKGAVYGKDSILAFYKKYWPKERMGTLDLDVESLERLSKNYYYITGYFHVKYQNGKKIDGRYSGLMKKIKGQWYLYTDHSG